MINIASLFNEDILIDTHAHLNSIEFDKNRDELLSLAEINGVLKILDVAIDLESSKRSIEISSRNKNVKSFIGIDPEVFEPGSLLFKGSELEDNFFSNLYKELKSLLIENKKYIFGIGETGMDFYHNSIGGLTEEQILESNINQEKLFKQHLELAQEFSLPLTIHSRGAEKECLKIAKSYNVSGIFHSYTGDYNTAKKILDSGFGLGINGIFTFKSAVDLREMYKKIIGKLSSDVSPIDFYKKGIFFETDSPYLTPQGKRGEINNPSNILDIYNFVVKTLSL